KETIQSKGVPEKPFYISAFDQYFYTNRTNHAIFLTGFIKPFHHIDFTGSYNYFQRTSNQLFKDLVTLNEIVTGTNTDVFSMAMSRGVYSFNHPDRILAYQAGIDLNRETAQGVRIAENFKTIEDIAFFGSAEFKLFRKMLVVKPGLRLAYNSQYK